ncbi:5'-3' exonuclease H3TH domain-containing protein [Buchnera aphidicola]|uniref:5'-3' exonuclease n=1 Tax=Buchnera aphidicola TaxID=9 RepID=UPI0034648B09
MNKKKNVILIDGHSYLYRSYYGLFKNRHQYYHLDDIIYQILYIFKTMFIKYKPNKFIIIFDKDKKNFRNKIFEPYKKNRKKMPEKLKIQIPILIKILNNIGIPVISIPNVEADDVIGTISKQEEKKNRHVFIGTSDKDLTQLVNKNIHIINNMNNSILTENEVKKKYGVYPNFMIDFLSLVGDVSDNIPGVKGIGKTIAIKLINKIGPIKKIYKNLSKIHQMEFRGHQNIIKKLCDGKDMAFLSYQLIQLKFNVNIDKKYLPFNLKQLFQPCQYYNVKYINIIHDMKKIILNNQK